MLKLRYLTNKSIDPIPYVKDELPESVLRLLSQDREEIRDQIISELTYMSAIGLLDIENSTFLHDYLITLTRSISFSRLH